MIKPPKNTKVMDWASSTFWFDETGIVCSISKKSAPQTLTEVKEILATFRGMIGDKKICLLADATNSPESTKEVRDYVAVEFPKFIKAIAILSDSSLGIMLANLFFKLKTQPYPTKMFNNEIEAKEWLQQFL
ncbi:MAG: hypothetical protein K0S53_471 [Bacteroidetes bacterium]|jgi:hypothetical protein|nr:hypothetical protein [Bacteroidota bacterium]MDF2452889.1 hypothetical protein [Bacteroidota bacterium]